MSHYSFQINDGTTITVTPVTREEMAIIELTPSITDSRNIAFINKELRTVKVSNYRTLYYVMKHLEI